MAFAGISTVSSFFMYFQNIGSMAEFPDIGLPNEVKDILTAISQFVRTIQKWIPAIPNFDVRSQLILISLLLPLLLNLILVWAIFPFSYVILQIIDIGASGTLTYFLSYGVLKKDWSIMNICLIAVPAFWVILRLIYSIFIEGRTKKIKISDLSSEICQHYMYEIQKRYELAEEDQLHDDDENQYYEAQDIRQTTLEELNNQIRKFSKIAEIVPPKISIPNSILRFLFSMIFLVLGLTFGKIINISFITGKLNSLINKILMIVSYVFACFLFLSFIFGLFDWSRRFLSYIKRFIKRYGLRLMMLILDMLYIPILQLFVKNIVPEDKSCASGMFKFFTIPNFTDNAINYFISGAFECVNCTYDKTFAGEADDLTSVCKEMCSQVYSLHVQSAPQLDFYKDELLVMGPYLFFVLFFVIIGIPGVWLTLAIKNSQILLNICIWGDQIDKKWKGIVTRMKTTGIFFFQNYKYESMTWCIILFLSKFLVVLITALAGNLTKYILFLLPIYYICILIYHCYSRPYLYPFNNFLDGLLYVISLAFSIIVLVAMFGIKIPATYMVPLSIFILAVPILSIILLAIFRCRAQRKTLKNNPTIMLKGKNTETRMDMLDFDEEEEEEEEEEANDQKCFDKEEDDLMFTDYGTMKKKYGSIHKKNLFREEYTEDIENKQNDRNNGNVEYPETGKNKDDQEIDPESMGRQKKTSDAESETPVAIYDGETFPLDPKEAEQICATERKRKPRKSNVVGFGSIKSVNKENFGSNANNNNNNICTDNDNNKIENNDEQSDEDWDELSENDNYEDYEQLPPIPRFLAYDINYKKISSIQDFVSINKDDESLAKKQKKLKEAAKRDGDEWHKYKPEKDFPHFEHQLKISTLKIQNPYLNFEINKLQLAAKVTKMYKIVDNVVDGATIESLFNILRTAMMVGCATFGWYLGSLFFRYETFAQTEC